MIPILSKSVSHPELVQEAAKWLTKKCSVVITELVTTGEVPDAIGWRGTHSTLIECKTSRTDFAADKKKYFRVYDSSGIGCARYYMAPIGLIDVSEIPEPWGLLELTDCGVCVSRKSGTFNEVASRHEIGILLSTLRRIGHAAPNGISIKCYTIESKNTATLGVGKLEMDEVLA